MGHGQAVELAQEYNMCEPTNGCEAEAAQVTQILSEEFGLWPSVTLWCMGVIKWDEARVVRGGAFKAAAVWVMSLPCGRMFAPSSITPIEPLN